jgi:hypothetical protein
MKKFLAVLLIFIIAPNALAQFNDHDGHLVATWSPPSYGNTLDHYFWSYTVNGVVDSVTGTSPADATIDSTVVLAEIGHWAVFNIWAVSVINDTSVVAVSDTAYYDTEQGIGPPTGVNWIQGP